MTVSINSVWSSKIIDLKLAFRERAITLSFCCKLNVEISYYGRDQQIKFVSNRIYVELTKFYSVHIFPRNISQQGQKIFTGVTNFSWLRFLTLLIYLTQVFIHYFINICLICNVIVKTEFRIFTVSIFNLIFVTNNTISKIIRRTFNVLAVTINIIVFSLELFVLALTLSSFSLQQSKTRTTSVYRWSHH